MRTIVVVGGGYAGFYAAWKLEKKLRRDEARVVVVDPRPYMTYQPFLPEVLAGSVEPRHAAVSLRRHLHRTRLIAGTVTAIDHEHRNVTVQPADGPAFPLGYDIIVVTAGAVTRKLAVPGVAEQAIGLKHVEEAVAIRDRMLTAFDRAAALPPGPRRQRLLTVTFAGGGFSGVEGFGELLSLATSLIRRYPELSPAELRFHLVEARDRILPEVSDRPGRWVVRSLEKRGARVHLNTQVTSARDGHVVLSSGEEYDCDLIVWTVGNDATPVVRNHTDLPVDRRGMLIVRADLRVGTDSEPVPDAWGAGDDAAVPDLGAGRPGAATVPNAQNAVRQGKLLARNIVAALRGGTARPYAHHSLGTVATLGLGQGIFEYRGIVIKGLPAWLMHRGYHVLAVPSWERKIRVLAVWLTAAVTGRDIVSLAAARDPRREFVTGGEPAGPSVQRVTPREYARVALRLRMAGEGDVGDSARGAHRLDGEALLQALQASPDRLTAAEEDGHLHDVHVVDQVGGEELADGSRAAADADVEAARGAPGGRERVGRAGLDEVEGRAALHLDRGPGVMGQHEDGGVERRLLPPPALPLLIGPRAALRAELVAAHDLRADARAPGAREGVVGGRAPAGLAKHRAE
jgi:NADH:ubiquinone reductase (H+-translocating)